MPSRRYAKKELTMSIQILKTQIDKFLATDTPEVLAIKGAWGVGKTFAWNKFLNEAKGNNGIALDKYSYVTLFGLNSLDELKLSMFMGVIQKCHIGNKQDLNAINAADKIISSLTRKAVTLLKTLPYSKNIWPTIESLSFYSLKKTIICIDDFERKGKALDAQDIMGLVSYLKEQSECKVVLILNDESLECTSSVDYKKYREKVIDVELLFKPTASECAEIALSNDVVGNKLKTLIETLKINNIRIIKKIEKLAYEFVPLLSGFEEEVVHQSLHSLILFTWCFYSKTKSVPDFEFIKSLGDGFFGIGDDEKKETDEEKNWHAILRQYDFQNCDEFDLQIANAVEHGFINEGPFLDEATVKNNELKASKSQRSYSHTWKMFHDTFDDNSSELVKELYNSFKLNVKYITPINLDGTVRLFRELGENQLADEIIQLYITERKHEKRLFALDDYAFSGDIKDKKLIEQFTTVHQLQKEKPMLRDVIDKISQKDGWGQNDEIILANATPEEYYEVFKKEKGSHLSSYIDTCLKFGRFGNASDQQRKIANNATAALKRIGSESTLNAIRIKKYGIKLDNET